MYDILMTPFNAAVLDFKRKRERKNAHIYFCNAIRLINIRFILAPRILFGFFIVKNDTMQWKLKSSFCLAGV